MAKFEDGGIIGGCANYLDEEIVKINNGEHHIFGHQLKKLYKLMYGHIPIEISELDDDEYYIIEPNAN